MDCWFCVPYNTHSAIEMLLDPIMAKLNTTLKKLYDVLVDTPYVKYCDAFQFWPIWELINAQFSPSLDPNK